MECEVNAVNGLQVSECVAGHVILANLMFEITVLHSSRVSSLLCHFILQSNVM